jgi:hypothetical protein
VGSEKLQQDEPIAFTLGVGNQSSICGGVKPMTIVDDVKDANDQPVCGQTPSAAVDGAS